MAFDLKSKIKQAALTKDQTQSQSGGFELPEEGRPNLRFVQYYDLGQHEEQSGQYKGKVNTKVRLFFELSGPKWKPKEVEGKLVPTLMYVDLNYSLNEKAGFFKLFTRMNAAHGGQFKYMPEMLGLEFKGQIKHREGTKKDKSGKARVYANLLHDTIGRAEKEDDDGNMVAVKVDPPLTELKAFLWEDACPEMWDDIFIPGEYPERKDDDGKVIRAAQSKNVIQLTIASALNFKGCPIYDYASGKVNKDDLAKMQESLGLDDEVEGDDTPAAGQTTPDRTDPLPGVD
jgi:hypothetical protein